MLGNPSGGWAMMIYMLGWSICLFVFWADAEGMKQDVKKNHKYTHTKTVIGPDDPLLAKPAMA